jgi:hypothetical protein
LVFGFLTSGGHLHASKYFTFDDLSNGLPSLILCCEIALVSPFFLIAYSVSPYKVRDASQRYYGVISAIFSAINIFDIVILMVKAARGRGGSRVSASTAQWATNAEDNAGRRSYGRRGNRMQYVSVHPGRLEGTDPFESHADEWEYSHNRALLQEHELANLR